MAKRPDALPGVQELTRRQGVMEQCAEDIQRPIFLFSAGWRSGSTLLQRRLIRIHGSLSRVSPKITAVPSRRWPPPGYF